MTEDYHPPTKSDLLSVIDAERSRLDSLLEGLADSQMAEAGVEAAWSIKDILAHIAAWERLAFDRIHAALSAEALKFPLIKGDADVDAFNAQVYEENKAKPLADVISEFQASHRDFRLLASICADLDRGGVVANIGSAVILPEVFLKALTVARNLNSGESRLTTANFDMIEHYRPRVNIVTRPTADIGKGFNFIGHHELMVPLLAWGLKHRFENE